MDKKNVNLAGSILLYILTGLVISFTVYLFITGNTDGAGGLIILVGPLFILIFIRAWIIRLIKRLMQKETAKVVSGLPRELELSEVKAVTRPVFIDIDKSIATPAATASREKIVAKAYGLFKRKYFYGVAACLVYIILPFLLSLAFGKTDNHMAGSFIFSIFFFLYISIQFLLFRKQFKPGNYRFNKRRSWSVFFLLKDLFHPRRDLIFLITLFPLMLFAVLIEFIPGMADDPEIPFIPDPWRGTGVTAAILLHIYLLFRLRKSGNELPNITLLILRVFGSNEKIVLTFGRLARFWQHFGSWFTIVDPSFLSPRFRFFTSKTLWELFLIFLLQILAGIGFEFLLSQLNISVPAWVITLVSASLSYAVYIFYWRQSVIRGFSKDNNAIQKKVTRILKRPRRFDMTYKNLALFCYDNTWRHAVNKFIKESRVVLMDLRGFSEKRKGCEYEIDFLFDNFPVNRVIFLVDNNTDSNFVYETILNRWEYLRVNSPNLSITDPVAKIFICRPEEDQADVQKLMDLLLDASTINS
jgi:hypothetical protein